jgi:hypothetical protein
MLGNSLQRALNALATVNTRKDKIALHSVDFIHSCIAIHVGTIGD